MFRFDSEAWGNHSSKPRIQMKKRTEEEILEIDRQIREAIGMTSEDYNAHFMHLICTYLSNQESSTPIGMATYHPFVRVFDMYHAERNVQLLEMLDKVDKRLTICAYKDTFDPTPLEACDIIMLHNREERRKLFEYHHHGLNCIYYRKSPRLAGAFRYYLTQYTEEYV